MNRSNNWKERSVQSVQYISTASTHIFPRASSIQSNSSLCETRSSIRSNSPLCETRWHDGVIATDMSSKTSQRSPNYLSENNIKQLQFTPSPLVNSTGLDHCPLLLGGGSCAGQRDTKAYAESFRENSHERITKLSKYSQTTEWGESISDIFGGGQERPRNTSPGFIDEQLAEALCSIQNWPLSKCRLSAAAFVLALNNEWAGLRSHGPMKDHMIENALDEKIKLFYHWSVGVSDDLPTIKPQTAADHIDNLASDDSTLVAALTDGHYEDCAQSNCEEKIFNEKDPHTTSADTIVVAASCKIGTPPKDASMSTSARSPITNKILLEGSSLNVLASCLQKTAASTDKITEDLTASNITLNKDERGNNEWDLSPSSALVTCTNALTENTSKKNNEDINKQELRHKSAQKRSCCSKAPTIKRSRNSFTLQDLSAAKQRMEDHISINDDSQSNEWEGCVSKHKKLIPETPMSHRDSAISLHVTGLRKRKYFGPVRPDGTPWVSGVNTRSRRCRSYK
eukprot:GHVL01024087.1.p1 GENE.GHVL01024087.1~~GHVL01024087.1.p1  ORF type:complete len:512 (+),score=74.78 GHVL01024087.1:1264-2799(+)